MGRCQQRQREDVNFTGGEAASSNNPEKESELRDDLWLKIHECMAPYGPK